VDEGEECDTGAGGNDPCCDDNCKLKPGAVCRCVMSLYVIVGFVLVVCACVWSRVHNS